MAKNDYPFKINGYIYSPRTKKGFARMAREGIPRPLFSIQNRLAKVLKKRYKAMARKLMKEVKVKCAASNIVLDGAPGSDSLEDLLDFFEKMGEELKAENQKIADKANLMSVAETLRNEWFEEDQAELERLDDIYTGDIDESFKPVIDKIFKAEQEDYIKHLMDDLDEKSALTIKAFSIDKKKFFNDNMAEVRRLYVDNAMQRIKGEEDMIKRKVLERIIAYATNQSDTLQLDDLTKLAFDTGEHLSRLFARDQMQRFNKACTLATFDSAGVTKVKWMTANDGRVRKVGHIDKNGVWHRPHTELQGKIFDIKNLPIEIDDYNCRCGLIPVEWSDD